MHDVSLDSLLADSEKSDSLRFFFPIEFWHLISAMIPSDEVLELYRTARKDGYVMVSQLAEDIERGSQSFSIGIIEKTMKNPRGIHGEIAYALRNCNASLEAHLIFPYAAETSHNAVINACEQLNTLLEQSMNRGMSVAEYVHRN